MNTVRHVKYYSVATCGEFDNDVPCNYIVPLRSETTDDYYYSMIEIFEVPDENDEFCVYVDKRFRLFRLYKDSSSEFQ